MILARKPPKGTIAETVLRFRTGALNVEGCRLGSEERFVPPASNDGRSAASVAPVNVTGYAGKIVAGRWPANVLLDEEAAWAVDEQSGESSSPSRVTRGGKMFGGSDRARPGEPNPCFGDSGGASRFFYTSKATRADREDGLESLPAQRRAGQAGADSEGELDPLSERWRTAPARNHHPTVKPTDLMRWLCRLVTPPGGTVLDPFCGSGSTGVAANAEGFDFVGIEREAEYVEIARRRIANVAPLFAEGGAA